MPPRPDRPILLTMGEPAGIGGEIALMAWLRRTADALPPFAVIDDPDRLQALAEKLGLPVPIERLSGPDDAGPVFAGRLPVLPQPLPKPVEPGRPCAENAGAVLAAIERAVALLRAGSGAALVTNPVHKAALYGAGFRHPGQTEWLGELAGSAFSPGQTPVMMLACPGLRVVPVTVHLSLREAIARLSCEAIVHAGKVTAQALAQDFGIARPRLAVAGLNPHAGEGGALGREEAEIISPAVDALRASGIEVSGPSPADSLFHRAARQAYDAVLCMYHDQALIPLKTVDFDNGVNITLGLPFIRTSPDHGTALGIAGTGTANPASLIAALKAAAAMAEARHGRNGTESA